MEHIGCMEILEGQAVPAPYVECRVWELAKKQPPNETFRLEIDTGACITCIPEQYANWRPLLLGRPVLIRDHNGKIRRENTYMMTIDIQFGDQFKSFKPERGVLLRRNVEWGLLGLDILRDLDFHMVGDRFILKAR